MRIPHIFTDQVLPERVLPEQVTSGHPDITLDGQAAQHLLKVLRMKAGDRIRLFNNSGAFYNASLIQCDKKTVTLNISSIEPSHSESKLHTHLGQVMSRGDRMDYVIQKSTELGVNEITPLSSDRCELKLNTERAIKRVEHWQQIAISAAEQCGRPCVPAIHPVTAIEDWVKVTQNNGVSLILHHRDKQMLNDIHPLPRHVNLLIGPEGGLSQREIDSAIHANFIASTFGPRVMRTETAPIACLSILQWLWGDFQSL